MASDSRQALIVRLDANIARAVRAYLGQSTSGYSGLDELVEVALLNQLNVEGFGATPDTDPTDESDRIGIGRRDGNSLGSEPDELTIDRTHSSVPALALPAVTPPPTAPLIDVAPSNEETLFVMTNRLSPIKIAVRALALAVIELGEWPSISDFHDRASSLARKVGTGLRKEGSRRWVGYPVGTDESKARDRFVNSFTIVAPGGRPRGTLALLGLAGIAPSAIVSKASSRKKARARSEPRVALTAAGWKLAMLRSPVLGEIQGDTLSPDEASLLEERLLCAPRERSVVREFLGLVRRSAGSQSRLDELMAAREPMKSADLLVAERAALVGRLSEIGLLAHEGRGEDARVDLTSSGRDTLKKLQFEERARE